MHKRKSLSQEDQARLTSSCLRRCCLCYCLDGKDRVCAGQIAHIDRNRSNADYSNLVWLCLEHHDKYDSKTSQSKNYTPSEIKKYKKIVEDKFRQIVMARSDRLRLRMTPGLAKGKFVLNLNIENLSKDTIRLTSWIYAYRNLNGDKSLTESGNTTFPLVLAERDACRFTVDKITVEPKDLLEFMLVDSDRVMYRVSDDLVIQANHIQERLDRLRELLPVEVPDAKICFDSTKFSSSFKFQIVNFKPAILMKIENNLDVDIKIRGLRLEWKIPEVNLDSKPKSFGPTAMLIGGTLNSIEMNVQVGSGEVVELNLCSYLIPAFEEIVSNGVEDTEIKLILDLSSNQCIGITEEGLPEAIRSHVLYEISN